MSKIRSKETGIERLVFRYLRREKIYFRKHYKGIAGSPDVALPRRKTAVFIDGDYWHGWKFQLRKRKMSFFWKEKIAKNITRDKRNRKILKNAGWKIMRVWGHDLNSKNRGKTLRLIKDFLR